jgi:hypothetical protein
MSHMIERMGEQCSCKFSRLTGNVTHLGLADAGLHGISHARVNVEAPHIFNM